MKPIFLIGFMGAGKSTLGKLLAQELGCSFIDSDTYIEARFCKTIASMFQDEGEATFRARERTLLSELLSFEDVVVATGGGLPCHSGNIQAMNEAGTTIYLRYSVETLLARLGHRPQYQRPKLRGLTREELYHYVATSLAEREVYYMQAKVVVDCTPFSSKEAIFDLLHHIRSLLPSL